jgi:hypothetical protein
MVNPDYAYNTYDPVTNTTMRVGRQGQRTWWRNGLRHRTNGPAVMHRDGEVEYWIDGNYVDPLVYFTLGGSNEGEE